MIERSQPLTPGITDRFWQSAARSEETKRLIRHIKRITRRKFTGVSKLAKHAYHSIHGAYDGGYDETRDKFVEHRTTFFEAEVLARMTEQTQLRQRETS